LFTQVSSSRLIFNIKGKISLKVKSTNSLSFLSTYHHHHFHIQSVQVVRTLYKSETQTATTNRLPNAKTEHGLITDYNAKNNTEHIPTDFIGNCRIKSHNPETECQLVLDLKANLST